MPLQLAKPSPTHIAILSRAPFPGRAKTRLIPALGAQGAADLHQRLLLRTVQTAFAAQLGPVNLWCTPDSSHPAFTACQQLGPLKLHTQSSGDLGARMLATLAAHTPTQIIGTDCPALTPEQLQQAAKVLSENAAVLIPAEDGGYVLIGLHQPAACLFDNMVWGCATVLEHTRQRLHDAGLRWVELPALWDVDEAADLTRLAPFTPELLKPL